MLKFIVANEVNKKLSYKFVGARRQFWMPYVARETIMV